ncbi:kinase-like domain-containing protein [Pelagophyceae sp. CCMP2097]|nr:kinase-like domain-containing protein [Pelagophyceae sp. CCMP2097]|mmetsp:Transcript_21239/g.73290  ORF Transcript_21239/g.73290 Transcript_21239/m.73290 type:complete len:713 (-) Transcript_21239:113-2251(-)
MAPATAAARKAKAPGKADECAAFEALKPRFSALAKVGSGSYGVVCSATDGRGGGRVAIKRVCPWADDAWDGRHTLRELRLLRLLRAHPNIVTLRDAVLEPGGGGNELFLVMELLDSDLHRIISSKQALSPKHVACLMAQLLLGAQAMHAVGVLHRDLKPGNVLVSRACELRITDFGLSRHVGESDDSGGFGAASLAGRNPLTEYVVTRWYRCPEVLLAPHLPYSTAVDCWSVGCIFGELVARKPLFQGKNFVHQVQVILMKLGTPAAGQLGFEPRDDAARFLAKQPSHVAPGVAALLPNATPDQCALCEGLLRFDPRTRCTVDEALQSAYFDAAPELPAAARVFFDEQRARAGGGGGLAPSLRAFKERATHDASFDFGFERADTSVKALREAIRRDVALLNAEYDAECCAQAAPAQGPAQPPAARQRSKSPRGQSSRGLADDAQAPAAAPLPGNTAAPRRHAAAADRTPRQLVYKAAQGAPSESRSAPPRRRSTEELHIAARADAPDGASLSARSRLLTVQQSQREQRARQASSSPARQIRAMRSHYDERAAAPHAAPAPAHRQLSMNRSDRGSSDRAPSDRGSRSSSDRFLSGRVSGERARPHAAGAQPPPEAPLALPPPLAADDDTRRAPAASVFSTAARQSPKPGLFALPSLRPPRQEGRARPLSPLSRDDEAATVLSPPPSPLPRSPHAAATPPQGLLSRFRAVAAAR